MTKLISKVFREDPVQFTGSYKKECPDEVTYKDQGKLPLYHPEIRLDYQFPFCRLSVSIEDHGSCPINEVNADAELYRYPKRDLFEPRMDKLYLTTIENIEKARQQVVQNPDIFEMYPRLDSQDIYEDSHFWRDVVIQIKHCLESEEYMSSLEKEISKKYGLSNIKDVTDSLLGLYGRQVYLRNEVMIYFNHFRSSDEDKISIVLPVSFPKEKFEEIKEFFLKHKLLKKRSPNISDFGDRWRLALKKGGCYLLGGIFKEDADLLPDSGPYAT